MFQGFDSLSLSEITVEFLASFTKKTQEDSDSMAIVLGFEEDDDLFLEFFGQSKKSGFSTISFSPGDGSKFLSELFGDLEIGISRDSDGFSQSQFDKFANFASQGSTEKKSLMLRTNRLDDFLEFIHETEIQQFISFVQNQHINIIQIEILWN